MSEPDVRQDTKHAHDFKQRKLRSWFSGFVEVE